MQSLKPTRIQAAAATCILLLASPDLSYAQSDIEAFGRACAPSLLPAELRSSASESTDTAFRKIVCENYYSDVKKTLEGGGELSVWVIDVSADGTSTERKVTSKKYCEDIGLQVSSRSSVDVFQRFTTTGALAAWQTCMKLFTTEQNAKTAQPVVAVAKNNNKENVTIAFRWNSEIAPDAGAPRFKSIDARGLKCPKPPLAKGASLKAVGDGHAVICSWQQHSRVGTVAVNHSLGTAVVSVQRPSDGAQGTVFLNVATTKKAVANQYKACGPRVPSQDLANKKCKSNVFRSLGNFVLVDHSKQPGFDCTDRWLRHRTCAELTTSKPGETISSPHLHCARNNQGSCEWNGIGDMKRAKIEVAQPGHYVACQQVGSHNIDIELCGTVTVEGPVVSRPVQAKIWPVSPSTIIEFHLPVGAKGELVVASAGEGETVEVGKSGVSLQLQHSDPDSVLGPYYQYRYIGWKVAAAK